MKLNQVTIPVSDLDVSIHFYQELGLRLIVHSNDQYARFECPDGKSTFSLHTEEYRGTGVWVYFEVDDLDEYCQTLKQKGFRFEQGPVDQPWLWREARLKDPDGHIIILYYAGPMRRFPPWRLPESKIEGTEIRSWEEGDELPWDLLLQADPDRQIVESYLRNSQILLARREGRTVGVLVLKQTGPDEAEIKNLSVDRVWQHLGLGRLILGRAEEIARLNGYHTLWIATADASLSQLYLYQSVGFEMDHIRKNHFIENYPEPLLEQGLTCRHQVVLKKNI